MGGETANNIITPQQLCVGLYIYLDLSWMEHPFTFSSFKISSLEQVSTLQSLGLSSIRYSPEKSDATPLEVPADTPPPRATPPVSRENDPVYEAKRKRLAHLETLRTKISLCEGQLVSAAKAVRSINQNVFARPDDARDEASVLIEGMLASMFSDTDVMVNLMNDQVAGEEVYYHSLNVAVLSLILARELKAPPTAVRQLGMGALFHDIGKVDIPDRVLRKTTPLTTPETTLLHQHCAKGVEIGRKLGLAPEALTVIALHHEHMDGSGYPRGLTGDQINLFGKIVAAVNTYDTLCNPIDPRKAMTPHEALSLMYAQQRERFDSAVMSGLVRCLGVYPPGTLVVLSNGTVGIVISVCSVRPLKPVVLIYDSVIPKGEAILVDLGEEADVTIARTLKAAQLPEPVRDYLSPRKRVTYYFDSDSDKSN